METGEESCSLPLTLSERACCNSGIEKVWQRKWSNK